MDFKYTVGTLFSFYILGVIFIISTGGNTLWVNYIFFALPAIIAGIQLLRRKKKKRWSIMSFVIGFCTYFFFSSGFKQYVNYDVYSITSLVYFILIFIFCIASPYTKPNGLFGIRIPATLEYPEVWNRAHEAFSLILSFFVIPEGLLIFFLSGGLRFFLSTFCLLAPCLIGLIYAMIIGSRYTKALDRKEQKELNEQIKHEQGYR